MKNNTHTPQTIYKDNKYFQNQMKIVYNAFNDEVPKTMLQVSYETGIMRANICRYLAKWRKYNQIQLVKFGLCPITKWKAGFYTTNLKRNGKN